uniref:Uncharacterized protein n=1 Tax=Arion vulgaris TaxID=1028688 RepID=A0A0B7AGF0_9EUPU
MFQNLASNRVLIKEATPLSRNLHTCMAGDTDNKEGRSSCKKQSEAPYQTP